MGNDPVSNGHEISHYPYTVTVPLAPEEDRYYPPKTLQIYTDNADSAYRLVMEQGVERLGDYGGTTRSRAGRGLQLGVATLLAAYKGLFLHEEGHAVALQQVGCRADVDFTLMGVGSTATSEYCEEDYDYDGNEFYRGSMKFLSESFRKSAFTTAAGINATQYATQRIALRMQSGASYTDIPPYLLHKVDHSLSIRVAGIIDGGNDVDNYWNNMWGMIHPYAYPGSPYNNFPGELEPPFDWKTLNRAAFWNIADPWIWYLTFKGGEYVWSGEENFRVPNFLPRTEAYLTTAGPIFQAVVPFCFDRFCFSPYVRRTLNHNPGPLGQTWGSGIERAGARFGPLMAGVGGDYWNSNGARGGAARFDAMVRLFRPFDNLFAGIETACKTEGPLPGYPDRKLCQLLGKFGFDL